MEIPKDLINKLKEKKVVPLIGAGMSRLFGYPGWKELIVKVSERIEHPLDEQEISLHDNLQMAEALLQYYIQTDHIDMEIRELINSDLIELLGVRSKSLYKFLYQEQIKIKENEFNRIVIDSLTSESIEEDKLSEFGYLNEIPFRHIITTNYDDVLENYIFNDNKYTTLIPRAGQEFEISDEEKLLIKLHGDCEEPESIVFTQSQYYRFMNDMIYYNSRLQTILSHNTLLMIGYGFGDINIHDVYFKFLDQLEESEHDIDSKKSYIVLTDYDRSYFYRDDTSGYAAPRNSDYYKLYVEFLKSKRIEVIEAPDLETFLFKLYEEYKRSTRLTSGDEKELMDRNIEAIKKIFVDDDNSRKVDLEVVEVLIRRSISFEEWIEEKADLRKLDVFEDKNNYYRKLQKYIKSAIDTENHENRMYLIGLSAKIVRNTSVFYEHESRLRILLATIEKLEIPSYRADKLTTLEVDKLRVFTNSIRDIFNFAKRDFGKAWDSYRLLSNQLGNGKYQVFELYIWSLESDLELLNDMIFSELENENLNEEWHDMRSLLINNSEKEWLNEISTCQFQTEIKQLLNENQRLTSELKDILDFL